MAIAEVQMMLQDPAVSGNGVPLFETVQINYEDFFLDGPVSRRVAVVDFDPASGLPVPGAPFTPGRKIGRYRPKTQDVFAPDFMQINVFATVFKTMYMYEEKENLGRRLRWGFDGPQLLVVPRAGEWSNAFYERESRSLQFFSFTFEGQPIYTCLSRDVVAHETGHAILDGIAPDLYNAVSPQSLALHEAVADLTALLSAFSSRTLRDIVLEQTGGSIEDSTAFSAIAEQFGQGLDPDRRRMHLRTLLNKHTLDPRDTSVDTDGEPNRVGDRAAPHELCTVLTGALYSVMVDIHKRYTQRYQAEGKTDPPGMALALGGELFQRMILRALDYLPPGEVSFADYGRAILAADKAAHPEPAKARDAIRDEFVRRHLAPSPDSLEVDTNWASPALATADLRTLVDSEWAAYQFVNDNRELLLIPENVPFEVLPRIEARKRIFPGHGRPDEIHECLLKVRWDHVEDNDSGRGLPPRRRIVRGTTLAIDWETKRVRARLTTDVDDQQKADRDEFIRRLSDTGTLQLDEPNAGPDCRPLRSTVQARTLNDVMRVRGAARALHLAGV